MRSKIHYFRDQNGGITAEFVMTSALLTVIIFSLIQLGIILYTRTILIDAASAGARHASLADRSLGDGIERASSLIHGSIPGDLQEKVTGEIYDGKVSITVTAEAPMIGFVSAPVKLEFVGHASKFVD